MRHTKRQVFVHLVGDHDRVVFVRQLDEQLERLAPEHRAHRVVGIVDQDEAGTVGDRRTKFVGVRLEVGRV